MLCRHLLGGITWLCIPTNNINLISSSLQERLQTLFTRACPMSYCSEGTHASVWPLDMLNVSDLLVQLGRSIGLNKNQQSQVKNNKVCRQKLTLPILDPFDFKLGP
ncbi:hypothetical protein V6N11_080886 [Hibiscus sabdariffa]|uniref:Uncharacterized protein n=1 Tax=Hibiscus sabdariffa TaxID=183260 RepID=A0ABR2QIQ0_9ROSI